MQGRSKASDGSGIPLVQAAAAARMLGVSVKALRVYERAGLIRPRRSQAGWRMYGPGDLEEARGVIALRALGFGLAGIAALRGADGGARRRLLQAHHATLEARAAAAAAVAQADRLVPRAAPDSPAANASAPQRGVPPTVTLRLPWPWAGEDWTLRGLGPLNYLTGPLGSGKSRLAASLAQAIPGAQLVGLERLEDGASAERQRLNADRALASRVGQEMAALVADGATECEALRALLVPLYAAPRGVTVVDMVEQALDEATQGALMRHLRRRRGAPLLLMTRSAAILDLAVARESELIVYCPANHSVPMLLYPRPGAAGLEAVATCLASPAVRERTAGVIACLEAARVPRGVHPRQ